MKEADALKVLRTAVVAEGGKMNSLKTIAEQLGVPTNTVYHWLYKGHIPRGRLSVFDLLKKRRAA